MDGGEEGAGLKRRRPAGGAYGYQGPGSAGPSPMPGDSTSSLGSTETAQKSKKRFVWPDDLHREFVAAIFDVGLKCASPKAILTMMKNSREVTSEHIKSHLQKYRVHRERVREEFNRSFGRGPDSSSRMETEMEGRDIKPLLGGLRESTDNQALILAGREKMTVSGPLTPMSIITECLEMQLGFQSMLKQALSTQQHMQSQLQAHFHAMGMTADAPITGRSGRHGSQVPATANDPSTVTTSPPPAVYSSGTLPGHHHHAHYPGGPSQSSTQPQSLSTPATSWEDPHGLGVGAGPGLAASAKMGAHHHHEDLSSHANGLPMADSLRTKKSTELQMEAEMRSHMDMHRQLLIRKKDQVSQYCAGDMLNQQPPPQAPPSNSLDVDVDLSSFKWNEECLDEDLFNFLRGDDGI